VRVVLHDATGVLLDVAVPGGAYDPVTKTGWKANRLVPPTSWKYVNKSVSPPGGIGKVLITDKSTRMPGLLKFVVTGKKIALASQAPSLPVSGELFVNALASDDQCAALGFWGPAGTAPVCSVNAKGTTLACK
jgi:hypothetical protein